VAGTYKDTLQGIATAGGMQVRLFEATLDTTCIIPSGFAQVLDVQATYKTCVDTAVNVEATWSDATVTITGKASAVDVVNVAIFGI